MDREAQIKELEQEVVSAAIALRRRDYYDDLYDLLGDVDYAVDRFLDFRENGSFREDREKAEKERKETEYKNRLASEVAAIRSRPEFQNITPEVIEGYIRDIEVYQDYGDEVMVEAIKEALRQSGIEVFYSPSILTWREWTWREGDRS